jgi:hypothetical protein
MIFSIPRNEKPFFRKVMDRRSNSDGKQKMHESLAPTSEMKERKKKKELCLGNESEKSVHEKVYRNKYVQTRALEAPPYVPYVQVKDPEDGLINVLRILCVDARDPSNIKYVVSLCSCKKSRRFFDEHFF